MRVVSPPPPPPLADRAYRSVSPCSLTCFALRTHDSRCDQNVMEDDGVASYVAKDGLQLFLSLPHERHLFPLSGTLILHRALRGETERSGNSTLSIRPTKSISVTHQRPHTARYVTSQSAAAPRRRHHYTGHATLGRPIKPPLWPDRHEWVTFRDQRHRWLSLPLLTLSLSLSPGSIIIVWHRLSAGRSQSPESPSASVGSAATPAARSFLKCTLPAHSLLPGNEARFPENASTKPGAKQIWPGDINASGVGGGRHCGWWWWWTERLPVALPPSLSLPRLQQHCFSRCWLLRWHLQWMDGPPRRRRKILFCDTITIIRNSYTSMELTARNVGHQWVVATHQWDMLCMHSAPDSETEISRQHKERSHERKPL